MGLSRPLETSLASAVNWQDAALGAAGVIGIVVAVLHGILTHRFMVRPLQPVLAHGRMGRRVARLAPMLLQFSTFNWLVGGIALIAATRFGSEARLATSLLVGSSYVFAAVGNFWATRGRHAGWMLMTAALVLIVLGAWPATTGDS